MDVAGALLLSWASIVAGASATAIAIAARRYAAATSDDAAPGAPDVERDVVVVRPCAGGEPRLVTNLLASGGAARVVVAIADERDGAADGARRAIAALRARGVDARLVVTHARGANRKADQIARALAAIPPARVVVIADSDVALRPRDLRRLLAPLADARVAASWAAPVDRASPPLRASLHAFPLLAAIDPVGMVGKLVALRADRLAAIGGFASLTHHLGEDVELARRLRARGGAIALAPVIVRARARPQPWSDGRARFARWIAVVRAQRPSLVASYPLLLAATPAIVAACAIARGGAALAAAAIAIAARMAVAMAARRHARLPTSPIDAARDAVAADALLWAAFARALTTRDVRWRGVALRLARGRVVTAAAERDVSTRANPPRRAEATATSTGEVAR